MIFIVKWVSYFSNKKNNGPKWAHWARAQMNGPKWARAQGPNEWAQKGLYGTLWARALWALKALMGRAQGSEGPYGALWAWARTLMGAYGPGQGPLRGHMGPGHYG